MQADGLNVRQLSQPIFGDTYTLYSWSPDGKQIAILAAVIPLLFPPAGSESAGGLFVSKCHFYICRY
ncbi:MAG: hypothetical protein GYA34_01045 [Chloroflexi bacterium]|nr:hypothetical protein [Chloroflexota bacterium]